MVRFGRMSGCLGRVRVGHALVVSVPVADVFGGGFLEAPVAVEAVEGPAPEGFGGLAMCAGGFVCGSASILPVPTGLACAATSASVSVSWEAVAGATRYRARLGGG